MQGRIIKQISNDYTVSYEDQTIVCKCRGIFRKKKITPLVGDLVKVNLEKNLIEEIVPRKNELVRPPISNIDQAFIITSVKEPNFDSFLLDQLLVMVSYQKITPVIIFTKLDLLSNEEKKNFKAIRNYYQKYYTVFENTELEGIKRQLKNKISVFTGQSGAGKSTLLNHLESSFQLSTNEISKALGRGKHTTRHTELFPFLGGLIADTPGFSSLTLPIPKEEIKSTFPEFQEISCIYRDCMHLDEKECKVKEEVAKGTILSSRYQNYQKLARK